MINGDTVHPCVQARSVFQECSVYITSVDSFLVHLSLLVQHRVHTTAAWLEAWGVSVCLSVCERITVCEGWRKIRLQKKCIYFWVILRSCLLMHMRVCCCVYMWVCAEVPREKQWRQTTECRHCSGKWVRTKWEGTEWGKMLRRHREERDCCLCVLPNLVNGSEGPGRQTNVVLWDGWHISFLQAWFFISSLGHKVLFQYETNWWREYQSGFDSIYQKCFLYFISVCYTSIIYNYIQSGCIYTWQMNTVPSEVLSSFLFFGLFVPL